MVLGSWLVRMAFVSFALVALLSAALPMPIAEANLSPRKIALLHMYDAVPFFGRLGGLTEVNKKRYADRHGYDFVVSSPHKTFGLYKKLDCYADTNLIQVGPDGSGACWGTDPSFDIDHSRAPTFGKIKLALAACQGRGEAWLLWSDADAMVINQTTPLESIIDDAYDIILSYDWLMLNAGMLLFKCSEWTKTFLSRVYNARQFDGARALDQSSFQEHLDNLTQVERDEHVKVIPKHAMNVYLEEYRAGDFLVHMAGKLYEATEAGLFAIANQLDILSMVEDVEDVKAFFRTPALLNYYSGVCAVKYGEKQKGCKPGDERRIFLNESLGSMSYPNRYRHVGLRYYWLGDWKDKYDVEGWNTKKKELARVSVASERLEEAVRVGETQMREDAMQNEVGRAVLEIGGENEDSPPQQPQQQQQQQQQLVVAQAGDGEGSEAHVVEIGVRIDAAQRSADGGSAARGKGRLTWYAVGSVVAVGAMAVGWLRFCSKKKMWSKIQ
ncbi:unnamed protein product [Agarophyton chilense]